MNRILCKVEMIGMCLFGFCFVLVSIYVGAVFFSIHEKNRLTEIAKVISAEACSEGPQAMKGVASTIKNRMENRQMSPFQIVTEPNQYYGYTNKNKNVIFNSERCSKPAMKFAKQLKDGTLEDVVGGAVFFRTTEEPIEEWHRIRTVKIGSLIFYR